MEQDQAEAEPCVSCGGRGWKLVSLRRGVLVGVPDIGPGRGGGDGPVRVDCPWCKGRSRAVAA